MRLYNLSTALEEEELNVLRRVEYHKQYLWMQRQMAHHFLHVVVEGGVVFLNGLHERSVVYVPRVGLDMITPTIYHVLLVDISNKMVPGGGQFKMFIAPLHPETIIPSISQNLRIMFYVFFSICLPSSFKD